MMLVYFVCYMNFNIILYKKKKKLYNCCSLIMDNNLK